MFELKYKELSQDFTLYYMEPSVQRTFVRGNCEIKKTK